jgi:tricorn protease
MQRTATIVHGLALTLALASASSAAATVKGYSRHPSLLDEHVVFVSDGDLWKAPLTGGPAARLTTVAGDEGPVRCSPNGAWIAYSAFYDGNRDVYLIPAQGGEPRRLTYHPGSDQVVGWLPDSSAVVFRSGRNTAVREQFLYQVPIEGGQPAQLPVGIGSSAAFSPDGRHVAFNRWDYEFVDWKRYQGGTAEEIWLGDLETSQFHQLTDWVGTDRYPMWWQDRIYFLSDRGGRRNLYSVAAAPGENDLKQHTVHEDYDVRWPDLRDGQIIYLLAGDLHLLDLDSGSDRTLDITLPSERLRRRSRLVDAARYFDAFSVSQDGSQVAVSSRGEIWCLPAEEGRAVHLTGGTSGVRERQPALSPDGEQIACISDASGEQEILLYPSGESSPGEPLTNENLGWLFGPVWSPTGTHLAYADLSLNLRLVDIDTGESKVIASSEQSEIREYVFSPDGQWIAYVDRLEEWAPGGTIWLYSLASDSRHRLSTPFSKDHSPAWDPQGRYLYFVSARSMNPIHGDLDYEQVVPSTQVLCVALLNEDSLSPLLPKGIKARFEEDEPDESGGEEASDSEADAEEETEELTPVRIDLEGLSNRLVQLPIEPGIYRDLAANDSKLFYLDLPLVGRAKPAPRQPQLWAYDLETKKHEQIVSWLPGYQLSGDGSTLAFKHNNDIVLADAGGPVNYDDVKRLDLRRLRWRLDPVQEWRQIFREAWRLQRDFYWDEGMAGTDWQGEYERYEPLLDRLSTRSELNDLIGELIGELGTSHANVGGGDLAGTPHVAVGLLGADVMPDEAANAHRFTRVLQAEPWETDVYSPLTMTHANVKEGDYLFAIDGLDLTAADNVHERLVGLAGEQVLLSVGKTPDREQAREVQIVTLQSERQLRYYDWVRRNREYVDQQTEGRIGYMHLPNMSGAGLVAFAKTFYAQLDKEAMVVDIRFNGGGNVSQLLIERFDRKLWAFQRARRGRHEMYPSRTFTGHLALVTNRWAGSDGDIFPESWRIKGLGPIIGTRTWGGVIGIRSDKPFIDGGMSTQPEYAWWEPNRGWALENSGVTPDIEVSIRPEDYLAGRDPQLDRTILELERLLEDEPIEEILISPIPDKSLKN